MSVTSCAKNGEYQPTKIIDTGCDWTSYIYLSDKDINTISEPAARQILTHNEIRQARCEKETK